MNSERREQIVEMIREKRVVKNTELMDRFGISIETVRRDLQFLEEQGVLERVYGGAVRRTLMNTEPEYNARERENLAQKRAIAREAQELIQNRDTVYFDIGTTVKQIAHFLSKDKNITAFTSALRTALILSETVGCDVVLPGGKLRHKELAVSGPLTQENMRQFNMDKAFIGIAGITEDGITDFNMEEASIRRQVIQSARQVIVLADSSKFGVRAVSNICPLDQLDILITDKKPPLTLANKLEKAGVQVIIA